MKPTTRVLLVEDDRELGGLVQTHLRSLPATVQWVVDGDEARRCLARESWDLLVLDIGLPNADGLQLCRDLRARGSGLPILMITARTTEGDRVVGLESGADDYLGKPFGLLELSARLRALQRRACRLSKADNMAGLQRVETGDLVVDLGQREVSLRGLGITLKPREFDLLWHFATNPGRIYSRAQLLEQVWGHTHPGYQHTVNTHLNQLRNKLGERSGDRRIIETIWGVGYRFNPPVRGQPA